MWLLYLPGLLLSHACRFQVRERFFLKPCECVTTWHIVISGSFGAFLIFNNLVSRKWLVLTETEWNLGLNEYSVHTAYRVLVKLNASGNSGVIRCISDFQQPCISKTAGLRAKHTPKSVCYPVFMSSLSAILSSRSPKPLCFLSFILLNYVKGLIIWHSQ